MAVPKYKPNKNVNKASAENAKDVKKAKMKKGLTIAGIVVAAVIVICVLIFGIRAIIKANGPQKTVVEMGDQVVISFTGYMNGETFEGGAAENYPLVIGSKSFIDDFEDQLVGHSVGETLDVEVTFPEDYFISSAEYYDFVKNGVEPKFANKDVVFKVTINDIVE